MRAPKTIKAVLIAHYIDTLDDTTLIDIYIGSAGGSNSSYRSTNTLCCNSCKMSGFLTCEGTGQYLVIDKPSNSNSNLSMSEILAFSEPLAAMTLSNPSPSLMTVTSTDVNKFPRIFKDHGGNPISCTTFDVTLSPPSLTFDLPELSQVSYVFLQMSTSFSTKKLATYVQDASSNW